MSAQPQGPWSLNPSADRPHEVDNWTVDNDKAAITEYQPVFGPNGQVVAFAVSSSRHLFRTLNTDHTKLIAAAPDLQAVASNFEITGPDADGIVWLVLHGRGTTGKAMFNLGKTERIAVQAAMLLEEDRRAAIAKATGSTS